MKEPFIYLRPEVTREHAQSIIHWLKDNEVSRHLSDGQDTSLSLARMLQRINLRVLTHLFSAGGRFFMIHHRAGRPVGFIRLVVKGTEAQMVIVIGERDDWGKGIGTCAILECMKIAFFEMRLQKIAAKIKHENKRSLRAFLRAGFIIRNQSTDLITLEMTMDEYLLGIQKGGLCMTPKVIITAVDRERLKKVISDASLLGEAAEHAIFGLEREMENASVVDSKEVAGDVVTMNSKVLLSLNEEEMEVSLVYPKEADFLSNRLSVLSPIGTAILGYSAGDRITWDVPSGRAHIQIKKVIYQPEAAGDFHL